MNKKKPANKTTIIKALFEQDVLKLKTQGKNYQEINKVPPQFRLTPSMLARLNENNDWEAVAELVEKESGETPDQSAAKLKAFGKTKSKK